MAAFLPSHEVADCAGPVRDGPLMEEAARGAVMRRRLRLDTDGLAGTETGTITDTETDTAASKPVSIAITRGHKRGVRHHADVRLSLDGAR